MPGPSIDTQEFSLALAAEHGYGIALRNQSLV